MQTYKAIFDVLFFYHLTKISILKTYAVIEKISLSNLTSFTQIISKFCREIEYLFLYQFETFVIITFKDHQSERLLFATPGDQI